MGRLWAREAELVEAIHGRIRERDNGDWADDAEYRAGQCAAIGAAVKYSLTAMASEEERWLPLPGATVEQMHRTARSEISLDTVLLFYILGHSVLGDFLVEEARRSGSPGHDTVLHDLRRTQDALLEHFAEALSAEYKQERKRLERTAGERRRAEVRRLLSGEASESSTLDYEFESWHLGIVAIGAEGTKAVLGLAHNAGCEILNASDGHRTVWAWLSGGRPLTSAAVEELASRYCDQDVRLATGEPRWGIAGWRSTHHEAQAALRVALRRPQTTTRCADVLLEAALLEDELLTASLLKTYLAPLDGLRVGGRAARDTLRAYSASDRQVSSTASLLGVARKTVERRLHEIETVLDRPLRTCLPELEVALRVELLSSTAAVDSR